MPLKSNDKLTDILSGSIENNEKQTCNNEVNIQSSYPPELQLAIDVYEQLCTDKDNLPLNKKIEAWLKEESKHQDNGRTFPGISNKKATAIASIIKSK